MNLNQGKRNKQAVQVLNKVEYDLEGNPIGMIEDPSNPASANFGTPREPRRGGCYFAQPNTYVELPLVTPVENFKIEFFYLDKLSGSCDLMALFNRGHYTQSLFGCWLNQSDNMSIVILSSSILSNIKRNFDGKYHKLTVKKFGNQYSVHKNDVVVSSGTRNFNTDLSLYPNRPSRFFTPGPGFLRGGSIFGFSFDELDSSGNYIQTLAKYNCSENSGNIAYDSSGNGHHGTIINAITTTPEENPNSIHQYQDVYSFENEEGYSESGNVLIPKNSSITLPPFKDVLGNNLQYVGKVPGKAKFVNSSCFLSDGNAYLSVDVLTTDAITAHPESEVPVCTIDGRLDFPIVGGKYFDITIERDGSVVARLPLCEPIIESSNHIYHDVSGNGNHATLINGTLDSEGKQDKFHYLQKGFNPYAARKSPDTYFEGKGTLWVYSNSVFSIDSTEYYNFTSSMKISRGPSSEWWSTRIFYVGWYDLLGSIWVIPNQTKLRVSFYAKSSITTSLMSVRAVGFGDGGNRNLFMDNSWRYYSFDIVKSGDLNASRSVHYLTMLIPEYTDINIVVWIDRLKVQVIGVSPVQSGDCCIDANGDPIDSAMSITQDSHSFLNTGTELEAYDYPALKQADKDDDFWNEDDGLGTVTPKPVQFDSLITQKGLSDKLFLDSSISETIKNVRMYGNNLKGRQLNTENKLTNN